MPLCLKLLSRWQRRRRKASKTRPGIHCPFEGPRIPCEHSYLNLRWDLEPVQLRDPLKSDRHIRLLLVQGSEYDDTDVEFEVFQVPLSALEVTDAIKFAALSYRWGNDGNEQSAYCGHDKIEVPVRRNLYQALQVIRFDQTPRLVWVDALCINQADAEEKGKQVRLMSSIYKNAHVCIWLGTGQDEEADDDVTQFLKLLWKVGQSTGTDVSDAPIAILREHMNRISIECGVEDPRQLPWIPLVEFLNNEWFTRLWIVQEVNWARSIAVHFGSYYFPLSYLLEALWIVRRFTKESLNPGGDVHPLVVPHNLDEYTARTLHLGLAWPLFVLRGSISDTGSGVPYATTLPHFKVVDVYRHQNCGDPRDKIFGLASMFEGEEAYNINYELTGPEVFAEFTLHCLRKYQDLAILNLSRRSAYGDPEFFAERARRNWMDGLPSWCPDWDGPISLGITFDSSRHLNHAIWSASATTLPRITVASHQVLGLMGMHIGIVTCSKPVFRSRRFDDLALQLMPAIPASKILDTLIEVLFLTKHDTISNDEEQMRSLISNAAPDLPLRQVKEELGQTWTSVYAPKLHRKAGFNTRRPFSRCSRIAQEVNQLVVMMDYDGKLFITDTGHLGSATSGLQAGDQLCLLYGGSMPYIVRPHEDGNRYELICWAHVPGLMFGEVLEMGLSEQEFLFI